MLGDRQEGVIKDSEREKERENEEAANKAIQHDTPRTANSLHQM